MLKDVEIIIRTRADEEKLNKLLEAGWKILYQAYVTFEGEPTRAVYQLYKEVEEDK